MGETRATVVVGAGGHGKVVVAALVAAGEAVACVLDDDPERWGETLLGVPIVGPIAERAVAGQPAILAVGDNRARWRLAERLALRWRSVVHPAASVDPAARLAAGAFVGAGAVIQPDASIGAHAIVNTGALVDHDCRIGECAHLAPGTALAGNVRIGEGALVGIGASVLPGVTIGGWAVLAAGGVAHRDLAAGATAGGVPARRFDER